MDYIDRVLAHVTDGGALLLGDGGINLLRTVSQPRDFNGCIFSRNLAINYPRIVNVKHPDRYFQYVCDQPLLDWAPFCAMSGGRASHGLKGPEEGMTEFTTQDNAGPSVVAKNFPQIYSSQNYPILEGISMWNSRLMLISGLSNMVVFKTGVPLEGMLPMGHLVSLFP